MSFSIISGFDFCDYCGAQLASAAILEELQGVGGEPDLLLCINDTCAGEGAGVFSTVESEREREERATAHLLHFSAYKNREGGEHV